MDILNNIHKDKIRKPEIEQVVKEQMEYTILGTYSITKGFTLFAYNSVKNQIRKVK